MSPFSEPPALDAQAGWKQSNTLRRLFRGEAAGAGSSGLLGRMQTPGSFLLGQTTGPKDEREYVSFVLFCFACVCESETVFVCVCVFAWFYLYY